jgi:hypothetical protein
VYSALQYCGQLPISHFRELTLLITDNLHYLHYFAHPAFFPGAFKSQQLLVLDSGTASVRSVASSKYSLHDFNYDPYGENAVTSDPFPSVYEYNFARNARLREFEGDGQSSLFFVSSVSLDDGCDALELYISDVEEEKPTAPEEQLPTDRDEIRSVRDWPWRAAGVHLFGSVRKGGDTKEQPWMEGYTLVAPAGYDNSEPETISPPLKHYNGVVDRTALEEENRRCGYGLKVKEETPHIKLCGRQQGKKSLVNRMKMDRTLSRESERLGNDLELNGMKVWTRTSR